MIFRGNANLQLSQKIANRLDKTLGKINVDRFSDGEILVDIQENVRGKAIFIIQSICTPSNDNLMELVIMADAFRRASAKRITAVIPYYGYARQDRRVRSARVPITAKVVADMLQNVGITRIMTVDLHADQIQGFFYVPVDNVYGTPVMVEDIEKLGIENPMIVSPDVGGVVRARALAKRVQSSDLSIIDKRRTGPNKTQVMNIIGDVKDRHCIIVDDIIDTAGTMCSAVQALKDNGAASVRAYCTHPVLSGPALENLENSCIDELVVTDTIPLSEKAIKCSRIRALSLSTMLAEAMNRVSTSASVSSMFPEE